MADTKISALTAATTPLAGTEVLPIVQSGSTVKVAVSDLTAGRTISASKIVSGNTNAAMSLTAGTTANSGANLEMYGNTSAAPGWVVYTSGTSNFASFGIHAFYKNDFAGTSTYLGGWFTNGDYRINAGNLVPGTAAKGINFTANTPKAGMTSQLLNWYEEGTWTPALTRLNATGFTYTASANDKAFYTRIGRQVTVTFAIYGTFSGGSGAFEVTGLPFTQQANYAQMAVRMQDINTGTWFDMSGENGTTRLYIASAGLVSGGVFCGGITYMV